MFIIDVPYLDLNQIYMLNQSFSWKKISDNKFKIILKDKAIIAEQNHEHLVLTCTEEEFYNYWFKYFDLQKDYLASHSKIRAIDPYLKFCCDRAEGVRVLHQDLFEVIVTSVLFSELNPMRTKECVDFVRETCGIKHKSAIGGLGQHTWYEFPTPSEIIQFQNELCLGNLNDKANLIIEIANSINDGWLNEDELKAMVYNEAISELSQFINNKNAIDRICLFGLHLFESFPKDMSINQVLLSKYQMDYAEFDMWYLDDTIDRGLVHQYLYYTKINPETKGNKPWV